VLQRGSPLPPPPPPLTGGESSDSTAAQDTAAVAAAKENLEIVYRSGDRKDSVTHRLSLPLTVKGFPAFLLHGNQVSRRLLLPTVRLPDSLPIKR
ncbi:MAG: hypothetical protein ACTTH7_00375, partial [Treponema sp.]